MYTTSVFLALALSATSFVSAAPVGESGVFERADSCTFNSGQLGTCISTAECNAQGGTSEAGHCPGAANIQCCTCSSPTVNDGTIIMLKELEGFSATPYLDVNKAAIGYGHQCNEPECAGLSPPITEVEATELMLQDLRTYRDCLTAKLGSVTLNENQYGALASWTFNVGCGNMRGSTLVIRLLAGEDPNTVAADELPKWRLVNGQVSQALVRRREKEIALFKTESGVQVLPVQCPA
ncbi:hypothetical protein W97_07984 [Coniosporium apollinis CBS 100218]|uniref:Lysozyme n=1 Tax=Coniosporium apollinis (strain CBS 100218) TaxID=1168221 RepID=R7Z482_CONA1|nr:uncharacterized protein W97_07984 [Coniosporium apollinis CBS 100218]EON68726.1 hypothetical protein W97_07984 [Coniosporium apollinis CBS 100218]